ncbi:hypothetical protein [Catellatospora vulcania]|uniref:hypothetical protein n=1 Tax=Catellatospora vulcania TaxID=1460450 RepID=UPI0012D4BD90|nr:hypothetical protein [Catellatospora vulcania]
MGRSYAEKTVKLLFGRANRCGYPDCSNALIFEDRGALTVSAQIAHIRSGSPAGPRYDPKYPEELVDQEENLILLCGVHHKPVDDHTSIYAVDELLEWKHHQISVSTSQLTDRQITKIVQHYDLNSLEPSTFEMLCQALTAEVLGPGTEIRGGCNPRHREDAAFRGRLTSFPSTNNPWSGYVAMQAWFNHSANAPVGRDMLRQKIWHEVKRWSSETGGDGGLEVPEYLILATNTSIPAAFGLGGRDEIEEFVRRISNGLFKGWLIWDEADLLRMLDRYSKVRDVFVPIMSSTRLAAELIDSYRQSA